MPPATPGFFAVLQQILQQHAAAIRGVCCICGGVPARQTQSTIRCTRERDEALPQHRQRTEGFIDEADRADQQMIGPLDVLIRRQYPDLFDDRGRLRRCIVARALKSRFGGVQLTGDQVHHIISEGRLAAARNRQTQ